MPSLHLKHFDRTDNVTGHQETVPSGPVTAVQKTNVCLHCSLLVRNGRTPEQLRNTGGAREATGREAEV